MLADRRLKKLRRFSWVFLFFLILEVGAGVAFIYLGYTVNEVDTHEMQDMLEFIKVNNKEYYERITSPSDSLYRREFEEHFIKDENKYLIRIGYIILIIAAHNLYPALKLFSLSHAKEDNRETKEKKPGLLSKLPFIGGKKKPKPDEAEQIMPDQKE